MRKGMPPVSRQRHSVLRDGLSSKERPRSSSHAEIEPLVLDEARGDALVDHIALLEKELPRRHHGSDDGDDEQYHLAQLSAFGHLRYEKVMSQQPDRWVGHQDDRDKQQCRAVVLAGLPTITAPRRVESP